MNKKLEEQWDKFLKQFWSKQCCPYPCINFQDSDQEWLDGAEAFYKFLKEEKKK